MAKAQVTIVLATERAKEMQQSLADLMCWVSGFCAGRGDDHSNWPMGRDDVQSLHIALKLAIREAETD